ncbi:MAG: thioredoxin-disulfide reductase [Candidatus Solincola sediminis]|uniref:Thioredoxin reductase n=1 Tax=Candidatus Solincola sediminis TaxID=1797199 RepID=A0A1F2WRA0_9ACTN|nr:MAG: thioredoxin-disulfide reductase [Candidatus Solincola sediminis]OFW61120.1 MAG: thioredoxin-disulfide reductase [Candidatus Solincola sediminis]
MAEGILDVVIVGGGPAGLTAGIYLSRARMKSVLVEKQGPGGSPALSERIENYPGFPEGISGFELVDRMRRQAENFGLEINAYNPLNSIKDEDGVKILEMDEGELRALGVIIATGMRPAPLGVPGEEEFLGKGVSFCATCDGAFFKDGTVAVIGGGNSAAEEALFLTRFAKKVIIVHRRDRLRAGKILQERVLAHPNIEVKWNKVVKEVLGKGTVSGLVLAGPEGGGEEEIKVDGVFLYVGNIPNTEPLKETVELDGNGFIVTDSDLKTSVDGIYAAGDVRSGAIRQVVVAVGEGARAAMAAQAYVDNIKGTAYI